MTAGRDYMAAVAERGPGFTELRTPWRDLPRDARGVFILPPPQLFEEAPR